MDTGLLKDALAIDAEARKVERERIMERISELKAAVLRHVPSGIDTVEVQDAFDEFFDHVNAV